MVRLASKEYWAQFERSPELVILFIPGEPFLGAALDLDAALLEDGMAKKIVLTTPATFIARAGLRTWAGFLVTRSAAAMCAALARSWPTARSIGAGVAASSRPACSIRKNEMVDWSCSACDASSSEVEDTCSEALAFCWPTLSSCWIA